MRSLKILAPIAALCVFATAADVTQPENKLWELRNLGKAFYENPDTHLQAVDTLRAALQLAPNSVRERVNYGIALLHAGKNEEGKAELQKAQKQDPSLPHTWFNLGIFYKHAGDYDNAIEQLKGMIRLVPNEPIPHYNLASVLRAKGETEAAVPEFLEAERLNPYLAGPHFQLFTVYQRTGKKEDAARERQLFEEAKKRNEGLAVPEDMEWCFYAELYDPPDPHPYAGTEATKYDDNKLSDGWDPSKSGMRLIDLNGDGHSDLLVWSRDRIAIYKKGAEPVKESGLESVSDIRSVAVGDYDNDGLADLCVVTDEGARLYHNNHGTFSKSAEFPGQDAFTTALWLDYDHDNDLDLLLFGSKPALMRNNGNGKFEDHTSAFPFVKGNTLDAIAYALRSDTAARDVVVSYADRPGTIYTDKLNEVFESMDVPALPAGATELDAQDFDHDGFIDVVTYGPDVHAIRNDAGKFSESPGAKTAPSSLRADFNGDKREDYARILPDGSLHVFTNQSADQRWQTARIEGIKNIKLAPGATVEMKSGMYYDKRVYQGVPIAFALDSHTDADTIRITWPNGLIQNEIHQKANEALKIAEAQRLSGSCPMIFTWNGEKFEFITDVLGVAPLGASSGDGNYFPVDHDEYIQIPGAALKAENGQYKIHITEELHEVSYLDQVRLIAVDHPANVDIYTNDKFKSPPYPEFRLFGSATKIHPLRAVESNGRDATAKVARRDHQYPDTFRHNHDGVAELHTLDLNFGDTARANHAALILNGWVDWADGSTFLGASQDGTGLIFPYLQVKDANGKWQTVVQDMGIPSGKPKTIAVDLSGKFLSKSREVRIVTNLCVYWDEIFLIENAAAPEVRLTALDANSADLHFRGFSRPVIDSSRQQPEQFLYDDVRPISNWNPTPGMYTRYGDVRSLVTRVDDRLTVMGSGDELSLTFPANGLPAVRDGWTRDFLLLVDGWAKDADPNTAFSQSVMPLPFHAMSAYPYKAAEHFPNDPAHAEYVREYLTRPALRLIRPLAPQADKTSEQVVANASGVSFQRSVAGRRVKIATIGLIAIAVLLVNSALLAAFPTDSLFTIANVLLHIVLGAAAGVIALLLVRRDARQIWIAIAAASGVLLAIIGNTRDHKVVFLIHVVISLTAVAVVFARRQNALVAKVAASAAALILVAGVCYRYVVPHPRDHIVNSLNVPLSMDQEGSGPKSEFFPSGAKTTDGKLIPSGFFMESQKCGECHRDIYEQWKHSMHHFASFNNQFYRKSIEYMQDVTGTKPSKWCAGCHDHAVFFNGKFDRPIKEQIDTPEAQAGLSCMSCHSIVHVDGSVGNASFTMSYPPLHEIADSPNPVIKKVKDFRNVRCSGGTQADIHEAVHERERVGVLLQLPQSSSGCAGKRLPLVPRLQRIRQLAGKRRIGPGRAIVLLSKEIEHLRRLSYAAGGVA